MARKQHRKEKTLHCGHQVQASKMGSWWSRKPNSRKKHRKEKPLHCGPETSSLKNGLLV
ncbi:hypothetical protein IJH06_02960 [Candidatus Saccharibacteria bacterium]|nr:hypothetical protein [Candidatus Saccharibacteria bacterium]